MLGINCKFRAVVCAAAFLSCAGAASASSLLQNGSFEEIAVTGEPWFVRSFTSLPGWTQYYDGVDLVHNNYTQGPAVLIDAEDGVQFLDMNQAGFNGGIFQEVSVTAGNTYLLTLFTSAWATNGVNTAIQYQLYDPTSGTVLANGANANTEGVWTERQISAVAIGNSLGVRIVNTYATQAASGLDNVQLTDISAAPEPGTVALLGLGGIGFLIARRRAARI
jgi:hypothetical protein